MRKTRFITCIMLLTLGMAHSHAKKWTLKECIDYALENNITLRKAGVQRSSYHEDVLQNQSALLPSLSASTSQSATYRPWTENGAASVQNGYVQSGVDKVYYNGAYNVMGNWTVWNGNKNHNTVKLSKKTEEIAMLDSITSANTIQEEIAQLFVQILYSHEAINVSRQSLETSLKNEQRGQEFVNVGKMSKADLAQLTAQRAQDEYNIVEAESNLSNYKRQLKQLLQLTTQEEFDIVVPETTDEMALKKIPQIEGVYSEALASRPEIQAAKLGIESSDINIKIAKAGKLPSVGLSASATTNTTSLGSRGWGTQMKNNFNLGGGVNVSFPIIDGRQTKTAINKAKLQKMNYELELQNRQTALYSTIESYWLQAVTNQNKFKASLVATKAQQESYELLSEQFRLGLKNIVELMTGKDNLIKAQQNELQSKYLAILNIEMLDFYQHGRIE